VAGDTSRLLGGFPTAVNLHKARLPLTLPSRQFSLGLSYDVLTITGLLFRVDGGAESMENAGGST
jgi:hypothetical protein